MASNPRLRTQFLVVVIMSALMTAGVLLGQRGCEERPVRISQGREPRVRTTTLRSGAGAPIVEGKRVELHYTLGLQDGTVILDTRAKGRPHTMYVGDGTVIRGLDMGIRGMKLGEVRRIVIPPELGYGRAGYGDGAVPANKNLVMEVELAAVN